MKDNISFCLWLSNFTLYKHIISSQQSVVGYLTCIHVLAIINIAAMNTMVYISFQIRVLVFSRYIYTRVGLLTHIVALFLIFKGTSVVFSIIDV